MSNRIHATRLLAAALLATLATSAIAQQKGEKKLYCWNENGRRVCGDALPAEAADKAREEFNARSGMRTGEVAAALTPEERAAAEAEAKAKAAQAESEAARRRREQAMAESYATEAELRAAFQQRIDLLDETLKASELGVTGLRQSLLGLLRQAGELELAGKPVPAVTSTNIAKQHAELRRREALLAQQRVARARLDDELAGVLARYRELKQPPGTVSPGAATPPNG